MELLRQARVHQQPAYAGWVAPLILENLARMRASVKTSLEESGSSKPAKEGLSALLDEIRGGFWVLDLPEAAELARMTQGFLQAPGSIDLVAEHLLWAVEWLDDAAFRAGRGHWPPVAPIVNLLTQWGHPDIHGTVRQGEDEPSPAPVARAQLAMAEAFCQHSQEIRARMETAMAQQGSGHEAARAGLEALGGLRGLIKGLAPGLGVRLEQARDRLAQIAYQTDSQAPGGRRALAEATIILAEIEQALPGVLLEGADVLEGEAARQEARRALDALAQALAQDISQVRSMAAELEHGQDLDAQTRQRLARMAGVMDMLEAGQTAAGLRHATTINPALYESLAWAEAWTQAATTYCPHVHRVFLESSLLDSSDEVVDDSPAPAGAQDEPAGDVAPQVAVAAAELAALREAHGDLGRKIEKWRRAPRVDGTVGIRRGFQDLALAAANFGIEPVANLAGLAQELLHESLLHLSGPSQEACLAIGTANAAIGGFIQGQGTEVVVAAQAQLEQAMEAMQSGRTAGSRKRWQDLPAEVQSRVMEFLDSKWPILHRPDHPDFWVALQLLDAALDMAGATEMARKIRADHARREMSGQGREVLSLLWRQARERQANEPEHLVEWLEANTRLAKQAVSREDARSLALLLREQAQLLADYGHLPNTP